MFVNINRAEGRGVVDFESGIINNSRNFCGVIVMDLQHAKVNSIILKNNQRSTFRLAVIYLRQWEGRSHQTNRFR